MKAKLIRDLYTYVNHERVPTWKKGTEIETLHTEPKTDSTGNEQCFYCRMPNGEIDEVIFYNLTFIEDDDSSAIDWEQRKFDIYIKFLNKYDEIGALQKADKCIEIYRSNLKYNHEKEINEKEKNRDL